MKKNLRNRILAHVLALVSVPSIVFSAVQTYDDTSASNVWDTTTVNWDGSTVAWTNGNDANFGGTGEAVAVTTVSANKINFTSTGYSLTGSTITLTGSSPTITATEDASITSVLAGSAGLVKVGSGMLSLSATNSYTGGTSVNAGTLRLGSTAANAILNGSYAIGASGNLRLEYATTSSAGTLLTSPTWANFTGAGTLTMAANGIFDYFSTDVGLPVGFTGTFRIDGGRVSTPATGGLGGATKVIVNPGGHFGMWNNGTTFGTGVAFEIAGTGYGEATYEVAVRMGNTNSTTTINGPVLLTASASVGAQFTNGLGIINGVISGSTGANLTIGASSGTNLTGTIALGGANTFAGDTSLTMGALRLDNALALQNSTLTGSAGAVSFNSTVTGNAFTLGALSGSRNLTLQNTASAAIALSAGGNNATTTYSGIMSGAGSLNKRGTGTMTLNAVNTYTGNTTVTDGILVVNGNGRLGNGDYNAQLSIASGTTFEFGATTGTQVMRGSLTGSGALIKSGGSTLAIGGVATGFSGPISLTGGTLQLRGFVPFGSGVSLDLADGTTLAPFALNDNDAPFDATSVTTPAVGTATIDLANTIFTLSSNPSPTNEVTVPIAAYSDLALGGGGVAALNLILPRNYSGALVDDSQLLSLVLDGFTPTVWTGSVNNLWNVTTDTNWSLDGGVTPDFYQQGDVVRFDDTATGSGAVSVSLPATVSPNSITFANASRPYALSGVGAIAGVSPITISGAGGVTLGTNNSFTGVVAINAGTLTIAHPNALGATGALSGTTVAAGAVLEVNGIAMAAETVILNGTGIGGAGALLNSSATAVSTAAPVVVGSAAAIGGTGNLTLSGGISGSFALSKVGSGALTIPNQVLFSGALSVNAGTLFTNGPNAAAGAVGNSSSVTINNGGAIYVGGDNSFVGHGPYASAKPITINTGGVLGCTTGSTNHLSEVILDGGTQSSHSRLKCVLRCWQNGSLLVYFAFLFFHFACSALEFIGFFALAVPWI